MRTSTIDKLCCPLDKNDLELTIISKDLEGKIIEGFLWCAKCNRIYPVIKGIPIMNPDEYREFAMEAPILKKWSQHLIGKKIEQFKLVAADDRDRLKKGFSEE